MRLLIDAGNTRIKWAVVNGNDWLHTGIMAVEQAADLPGLFAGYPLLAFKQEIQQIWVSNVAGEKVAGFIREIPIGKIKAGQVGQPHFIAARETQCGVRNGYAAPSQLGSDRWAALIAAWQQMRKACLVVNCGTATTIDTLSEQGVFLGGLIVPGVEMMQSSLISATDQLELQQGKYAPFPKNTADALHSGAIQATCGAIERQHALLDHAAATVVLSGGAATVVREHLKMPLHVMDNMVLQGLLIIAQEADE